MRFRELLVAAVVACWVALSAGCGTANLDAPLTPLSGKAADVKLSDFKGKVVVVDFWATWCGPCRVSMPVIQKIYDRYKNRGVEVVSITTENRSTVEEFARQNPYSYPVYLDTTGKVTAAFGIDSIPRYVVMGKDGKVVGTIEGAMSSDEGLASLIDRGLR